MGHNVFYLSCNTEIMLLLLNVEIPIAMFQKDGGYNNNKGGQNLERDV